ncbi:MAG: trigger factor [Lysobacteraceae bacterium]|nr:MAG: trigger factor [Xanthomonadaceae bacterium]
MEVSVESTGALSRRMTVQVPVDSVNDKVSARLRELGREVHLKGFRPGKVPPRVIEQRFGAQVRREVTGEVMQESLREALEKEEIRLAGMPEVDAPEEVDEGKLQFVANFEVYPQLDSIDVSGLEVTNVVSEVGDDDVEDMLNTLRMQRRSWRDTERASQEGDLVLFEFAVDSADGRIPAEGEHRSGTILGSGVVFEALESALVGVNVDDEKEVELAFPEDFPESDVAGKSGKTSIKISKVQEPIVPNVDDAFAESFGIDGGVDALKRDVSQNLGRELRNALSARSRIEVVDSLVAAHGDIELPQSMIDREAEAMRQQAINNARQAGAENVAEPAVEEFAEKARERVAAGILLVELARQNGIETDQGRVRDEINSIAATYENPREIVAAYYENEQYLSSVQSRVLEEQVVEWIIKNAKTTDKSMSFSEVMAEATANQA